MSSHSSSRKCGARVNGAVGGGSGDMPATRKLSGKADCAQGKSGPFPSSLEVLEHGDADDASTRSNSRISLGSRSRSNLSSVPPRSDSALSQRVPTPTKHVSLTAVRRKQEVDTPIEPELDWRQFSRSNSKLSLGSRSYSNTFRLTETDETQDSEEKHKAEAHNEPSGSGDKVASQMEALSMGSTGQSKVKDTKEISDDNDDESDDSDDSDSEDEPRKAPNELLMEFLDCVMKKDFKNAEKLCRMILIYEPTNQEALTFHPIIMEKLQLEQEAAEARDGDDDDDDEDDDDDSEEDSSLESDSSDDDDDDDEEAEEQEEDNGPGDVIFPEEPEPGRPDSGIGM